MLSATHLIGFGAGGVGAQGRYAIDYSCRFNDGDSSNLTRQQASGTGKKQTIGGWFKIGSALATTRVLIDAGSGSAPEGWLSVWLDVNDQMRIGLNNEAAATRINTYINMLFRDPHAWYHLCITWDTTPGTPIFKIFINNVEQTLVGANTMAQNDEFGLNANTGDITLCSSEGGPNYFDGYLSQWFCLDGTTVTTPVAGGIVEVDSNGVVRPVDLTGLTFGNEGWLLDFADASTKGDLGIDAKKSASDSVISGVSYWDNDGTGWSNGTGTIDSATAGYGNGSSNPISGNFTWTFTIAAGGQDGLKFGVFDATEYSSFDNTDDSGGMDTMTKSWFYSEDDGDMYYGSAAQSASPSIADGSVVTITRTGSTIKITDDGADEHTFSQTFAGPVFLGYGCKNTGSGNVDLNSVSVVGAICFITSGLETNDRVTDTPTNNFMTISSLSIFGGDTLADGNLVWSDANSSGDGMVGSMWVTSGKWYWEVTVDAVTTGSWVGVWGGFGPYTPTVFSPWNSDNDIAADDRTWVIKPSTGYVIDGDGQGDPGTNASLSTFSATDVISFALDMDQGAGSNKLWIGKEGTWETSGNPDSDSGEIFDNLPGGVTIVVGNRGSGTDTYTFNFGSSTAGFTYDGSIGNIVGFNALNTTNMPVPAIVDPSIYVQAHNYTGTGSAHTETLDAANNKHNSDLGTLDMLLLKNFAEADSPRIFAAHTELGNTKAIPLDDYSDMETNANGVTSIGDVNAFGLGSGAGGFNDNGESFSAYCFNVAKTAEDTNEEGSIDSKIIVNDTAGWSMGTWEGTGANATIGHGLSTKPNFLLLASLDFATVGDGAPRLGFTSLGWDKSIGFTGAVPAVYDHADAFQDLAPTDSIFYVGSNADTNHSGDTMFFFAAYDVPGFSTWGTPYRSNANVNGPVVYYGFSAEFIWLMRTTGATVWTALDVIRDPYNQTESGVRINDNTVGNTTTQDMDILSNGLKIRHGGGDVNDDGDNFYVFACAKNPFGGQGGNFASGVSPATAR